MKFVMTKTESGRYTFHIRYDGVEGVELAPVDEPLATCGWTWDSEDALADFLMSLIRELRADPGRTVIAFAEPRSSAACEAMSNALAERYHARHPEQGETKFHLEIPTGGYVGQKTEIRREFEAPRPRIVV